VRFYLHRKNSQNKKHTDIHGFYVEWSANNKNIYYIKPHCYGLETERNKFYAHIARITLEILLPQNYDKEISAQK